MNSVKKKWNLHLLLWSAVLMFSVGGNIFLASPVVNAQTVYITRTGSKYHTHKCGNGTYFPASLSEAQSQGLTPCAKCFGSSSPVSNNSGSSKSRSRTGTSKPKAKPIKINKTSLQLVKGQTSKLKISNATRKVKWKSSKKSVVSVSSSGKVKAKKKGKAVITGSVGSQKKKCKVTIEEPKLNKSQITLDIGNTYNLKLLGCKHSVKWSSSDTDVAKVTSGKITAKDPGLVTITAKVHNQKYNCKVIVNKPAISQISLSQNSIKMGYDERAVFSINVSPKKAIDYYDISARSADDSIVTAIVEYDDSIYIVSYGKTGKTTIYISVGDITTELQVEVVPCVVDSLKMNTDNIRLTPDQSKQIYFTVDPSKTTNYFDPIWSSDNEQIVKVEKICGYEKNYANLIAVGEGETNITVTLGDSSATCHVTVAKPKITSLYMHSPETYLYPGGKSSVSFIIEPYRAMDYYDIIWSSSDENVVKVENNPSSLQSANVSAVGEGEADVTVTIGDSSATYHVTVGKPKITSLYMHFPETYLYPDGKSSSSFIIEPYIALNYYDIIWSSSDENVVKVENNPSSLQSANVSAVGEGEADVTVTIGDSSATYHVTVGKPKITSLYMHFPETYLYFGEKDSVSFTIEPYRALNYYDIIWSSSNESVVKVENNPSSLQSANISAVGEGEADVIVTIGDKSASCHVIVQN